MITEKNPRAGGCCSGFKRGEFYFDTGVHYFGGIKGGSLEKILSELDILENLKVKFIEPPLRIIMSDLSIRVYSNQFDTLKEFSNVFKQEKNNLKLFFDYILKENFVELYSEIKHCTFKKLLDKYFLDERLKAIFNILLANIGLSSDQVSALSAIALFRQYIFKLGYSMKDGSQEFADFLVKEFKRNGGKILFSSEVAKILTKDKSVDSILLKDGRKYLSNNIISNVDATSTFSNLLDYKTDMSIKISTLKPSLSVFSLFVGLITKDLNTIKNKLENLLICSSMDSKKHFLKNNQSDFDDFSFILITFPFFSEEKTGNKLSLTAHSLVPYISKEFWSLNREKYSNKMFKLIKKYLGGLVNEVVVFESATPVTYEKYTSNRDGAAYGWETSLDQIKSHTSPVTTEVKGLYLTGHWATSGLGQCGVPGVAISGRKAAELVLTKLGKIWPYGLIKM